MRAGMRRGQASRQVPPIWAWVLGLAILLFPLGCDQSQDTPAKESAPPPVALKPERLDAVTTVAPPEFGAATFRAKDLYRHAALLASEECEGRLSGTEGCRKARDYVVQEFKKTGLKPVVWMAAKVPGHFQEFDYVSGVALGSENILVASTPKLKGAENSFSVKQDTEFVNEVHRLSIEELERKVKELDKLRNPKGRTLENIADEVIDSAIAQSALEVRKEVPKDSILLEYKAISHFRPLRISTGWLNHTPCFSRLVFAGYGIRDAKAGYDDYAGLDVKGKLVLALRGEPETPAGKRIGQEQSNPHAQSGVYSDIYYKASTARDQGALALILVTGYRGTTEQARAELISFDSKSGGGRVECGIPVVQAVTKAVEDWFLHMGKPLEARQKEIDAELKPHGEELKDVRIALQVDVRRERLATENVIGFLPGNDPKLKEEVVVIGAHYDHLGRGNEFSLADKAGLEARKIHYGADDNASGVASLIELAKALSAHRKELKRSVYFAAFSGEELGTLGSLYFVKNPPPGCEMKNVAAMLNLDMVGRCREEKVMAYGAGTGTGFEELLKAANEGLGLKIITTADGFGGSDHQSFTNAGVPVLFFFTGSHADYHKPTDTLEKLNVAEQARITALVYSAAARLAQTPERPKFLKVEAPAMRMTGTGGVRLGTLPDYSYEGKGLRITGVRGGSPADKAGLKAGDVIVEFAGQRVENIYDYMNGLRQCKPGAEVELVFEREGKRLTAKALPEGP